MATLCSNLILGTAQLKLTISDASGKLIENTVLKNLQAGGKNTYSVCTKNLINGGIYYITIETTYEKQLKNNCRTIKIMKKILPYLFAIILAGFGFCLLYS
ncbi:MAG: hypothetical protein IPG39_21610 [Bacteroidetes bacterium]|nr:hypothetical protein [Bacteroidota bacterium]